MTDTAIAFETWRAVSDLMQIYADCMDRQDVQGVACLFTHDAEYHFAPGQTFSGRDEIASAIRRFVFSGVATSHHLCPPLIRTLSGNRISAITYATVVNRPDAGGGYVMYGRYHDLLVRHDNTVLFQRRKIIAHIMQGEAIERYRLGKTRLPS